MNIWGDTIQPVTIGLNKNEYLTLLWLVDGLCDYPGNRVERNECTSPYPLAEAKGLVHCNDPQPNTP